MVTSRQWLGEHSGGQFHLMKFQRIYFFTENMITIKRSLGALYGEQNAMTK